MTTRSLSFLLLCLCYLLSPSLYAAFDSKTMNADKPLKVVRITPTGRDVEQTRQIVFQFNQSVVPIGEMARSADEIPVTITPALACEWRWLDSSALACQLTDKTAMQFATRYRILMSKGITTENGKTLEKPVKHEFVTKRPQVSYASFQTWRAPSIPEIRLSFNQSVSQNSVAQHIYFQKPNGQRIDARVFWPEKEADEENEADDDSTSNDKAAANNPAFRRVWMISPKQLMPLDSKILLNVEAGLQSQNGPERGIEARTVTSFSTFPQFKFLGLQCYNASGDTVYIEPDTDESRAVMRRCDPLERVALRFSSPVLPSIVRDNILLTPDLAGGRTDYNPWERVSDYSYLGSRHQADEEYTVWLPELLKAYQSYQLQASNLNFRDEFGRPLVRPIRMQFATAHRAPSRTFEHQISVLESGIDSEVPIYVTNLDKLDFYYHRMPAGQDWQQDLKLSLTPPKIKDVSMKIPFGVRELLGADTQSGVVMGSFAPTPPVRDDNYRRANWFFSQVTPFYVQAKVGHFNSLIWVMDFATGQPIKGAKVELFRSTYDALPSATPEIEGSAETDAYGVATLAGTSQFDPNLAVLNSYNDEAPAFFLKVTQGESVALLPLDYNFQVSFYDLSVDYDTYPYLQQQFGHVHSWGTTAQGIYKVGDTVQYKLFVRNQDNKRFVAAPEGLYTLTVTDPMNNTVHEVKEVKLSEFGGLAGEFEIPKTAPVGWYSFQLSADFTDQDWWPMQVLVSDFTPSPFRVRTSLNGELFTQGQDVQVDTSAQLHAGGPYVDAQTRITAMLSQEPFSPSTLISKGFQFDTHVEDAYDDTVFQTESKVDNQGQLQTTFKVEESPVLYGQLRVESAVRDDRGKNIANTTTAQYVGRDRFVGLKQTSWVVPAKQTANILTLVVDGAGNPVADVPVDVLVEYRETKAARVKGAGNAYLTQFEHEWVKAGACQLSSSAEQALACDYVPPKAGTYRITATIKDSQDRPHSTESYQWVSGSDAVVWDNIDGNGIEIIPEQNTYKVGETARYLVKNPYQNAQALVTVERFGVLTHWLTTLKNSVEIIEVPVLADYEPGFFVSITLMSPRQNQPLSEDGVDLGKPSFRMGYVRTMVSDPYKELKVAIQSDKPVYRPRDKVTLNLQVQSQVADLPITEPVELTIAVLDESVFDLLRQGRSYFDPYRGFYSLDNLDLSNYSLLLRLVGRQKFEKKGASAGGDGGLGPNMRSLFKFVSYWNSGLKTDEQGRASVSFDVPDNLTGWRVLAIAMTPSDRMGLGDNNFKVNLPLELRPVMPNQVTSGDRFQAGINVMNRTEKAQAIKVQLTATGTPVETTNGQAVSISKTVQAEPYKRYTVWLPVQTTTAGDIQFTAQANSEKEADSLTHSVPVRMRKVSETAATYGTTVSDKVTESVLFPANSIPNVGDLSVLASPTVISGVDGPFEYMRDYPYYCWEQRLSKGTMAAHYQHLKPYMTKTGLWPQSEGLTDTMLGQAKDFQAPNGGMAYYVALDNRASPYLSAYTALAFNWLRDGGYAIPDKVENQLHEYLTVLLRRDVLPDFYSKGMSSSVRAVALQALAMRDKVTRADLQRYETHVPQMDLFGKAAYLQAAMRVPQTERLRTTVVEDLLSHVNQSGGKITLTETLDDSYKHILSSSLRTQCVVLSALLTYDEMTQDQLVADIPFKLVRAITAARKGRGGWSNTQENMFCMNALIDYARVYEAVDPAMTVSVLLDDEALPVVMEDATATPSTHAEFNKFTAPPVTFRHDIAEADVGRKASVTINREGEGRVYYALRLNYATQVDKADSVNAGMSIEREYHVERDGKWQLLESPMQIETGELVRVDLYLSLPTARYFVVVDDPVAGGLEPVNRDLATSSEVDADKAEGTYAGGSIWFQFEDWREYAFSFWSFYHKELRHHAAIFYSHYLPAGRYHLAYTAQAIAAGEFLAMPTKAEEMYEPDIYGLSKPAQLVVQQAAE